MFRRLTLWLLTAVFFTLGSCNNRAIMFRAKHNFQYSDIAELKINTEYKIGVNDEITIDVASNQGASMIENGNRSERGQLAVVVDFDGTLKMPLLGRISVNGLTVNEAELLLEELYKRFLVDPYVHIEVTNKRVILFPGVGGSARVINLKNKNTTLIEALAQSGGVNLQGKSNKIKIFRKAPNGDLRIYKINLSKIDYVEDSQIILQSNDVVYVEPRNDLLQNFAQRATGYFFVLNTLLLINNLVK